MKKFFYLFVAAVTAVAFTSCGDPVTKQVFTFSVDNLTYSSAVITVKSADDDAFYWDIISKEELAEYADIESYWAETMQMDEEYYKEYASEFQQYYGINSYAELLEEFQLHGEDTYEYTGLAANTEYIVFAFKIGDQMNILSNLETYEFKTPEVSNINLTFTIEENDTAFFFIPSDEDATYLAEIIPTDTLNYYGINDKMAYMESAVEYYAEMVETYSMFGIGWDYFLYWGEIYIPKSQLLAGQENHFLAIGVADGVINSQLVDLTFTSGRAPKISARIVSPDAKMLSKKTVEAPAQNDFNKALRAIKK